MENTNGYDMSRPAGAWVKKPAVVSGRAPSPATKPSAPATLASGRGAAPTYAPVAKQRSPKARRLRYQSKTLAAAGIMFVASAIAVLAAAALISSRPVEASGSPELGSALEAALSGEAIASGDSPVSAATAPAVTGDPAESVSLGTLLIPAIGLEAEYYSGVHDAVVARGPGLWPGTPLPGAAGNSVFAGHRTTHSRPFKDLDRLEPGDLIEATSGSEIVTEFRVVSVKTIRESDYVEYALADFDTAETPSITLLACAPKGSRSHRIVVRAAATPTPERGDA